MHHHVTSVVRAEETTIEVDGSLDAVAAFDLQCCLDSALVRRVKLVALDLTRVTTMDHDGVLGLRRCRDTAVEARVVLTIAGCSRPALRSLTFFEARSSRERTHPRATTAWGGGRHSRDAVPRTATPAGPASRIAVTCRVPG